METKRLLNQILAVSLLAATLSTGTVGEIRANALGVAAGTTAFAAASSVIYTMIARHNSTRRAAEGVGSHLKSAGGNLKNAVTNMGENIKDGASAIKRSLQSGAHEVRQSFNGHRATNKVQQYFEDHGVATSVACILAALVLGGMWLSSKDSR